MKHISPPKPRVSPPSLSKLIDIRTCTGLYEAWLGRQLPLLKKDLASKHLKMALDSFSFFRATFYRWMQLWPLYCPESASAPKLLSVGDLHVENFGTWRDAEGRLVWGINDFDEAAVLPYTLDLVRLAASALLAISTARLSLSAASACRAVLEGYCSALKTGGKPFVLAEENAWLRDLVTNYLRDPERYWDKLCSVPQLRTKLPAEVALLLKSAMPDAKMGLKIVHREAGLGSLGRERYTAIGDWNGGKIAREAKPLVSSAANCEWLNSDKISRAAILYPRIVAAAVRSRDPFLQVRNKWVVRRLAPYCSRIELRSLPKQQEEEKLLIAMGFETANVHLGSRGICPRVLSDLHKRPGNWLVKDASAMAQAVQKDWSEWCKHEAPAR